jgi:hypothetical protein
MLELSEDLLIGTGRRRRCFQHPDDPGKCVKVSYRIGEREMGSKREEAYYRKYERRGCSLQHLAKFYGTVETNQGLGYVFELVRDADGSISPSLGELVRGGVPVDELKNELVELRDYMFTEGVIAGDFNQGNILVQQQEGGRRKLVIIDGLGNSDFVKVADYLKPFRDRKLRRKWEKLWGRLKYYEAGGTVKKKRLEGGGSRAPQG